MNNTSAILFSCPTCRQIPMWDSESCSLSSTSCSRGGTIRAVTVDTYGEVLCLDDQKATVVTNCTCFISDNMCVKNVILCPLFVQTYEPKKCLSRIPAAVLKSRSWWFSKISSSSFPCKNIFTFRLLGPPGVRPLVEELAWNIWNRWVIPVMWVCLKMGYTPNEIAI